MSSEISQQLSELNSEYEKHLKEISESESSLKSLHDAKSKDLEETSTLEQEIFQLKKRLISIPGGLERGLSEEQEKQIKEWSQQLEELCSKLAHYGHRLAKFNAKIDCATNANDYLRKRIKLLELKMEKLANDS